MLRSLIYEALRLRHKTADSLDGLCHEQSNISSSAEIDGVFHVFGVEFPCISHTSIRSSVHVWVRTMLYALGAWDVMIP